MRSCGSPCSVNHPRHAFVASDRRDLRCLHCAAACQMCINSPTDSESCCVKGESLPMRGTIGQLQERLAAAGVGHRPVIFVCHRWYRIASTSHLRLPACCTWSLSPAAGEAYLRSAQVKLDMSS